MPKKTEYVTDDELTGLVSTMLANENLTDLQPLRENEIVIMCCMKVRMDEEGETESTKGNPVKLKKLSDVERLFIKGKAHYTLVMDYHFWKNSDDKQRWAKLFDVLYGIKPEKTEAGLKLKKRERDIPVDHAKTLALFGPFDDGTLAVRDAFKDIKGRFLEFVDNISVQVAPKARAKQVAKVEPESDNVDSAPEPEVEAEEESPRVHSADVDVDDAPEPVEAVPKSRGKPSPKK